MAHGHMIPAVDMAKLFASRGCKATVILTPANALFFTQEIERSRNLGLEIEIVLLKFPVLDFELPEGCENVHMLTSDDMVEKFFKATTMLEQPLEELIKEHRPNCLVADITFSWATEVAARFGIPRLVFHGVSFFALCTSICLMEHEPYKKVSSDSEPFVVPNLPHEIKLTRDQLPPYIKQESELATLARQFTESEETSYGVIVNSYYELEPDYADYYRRVLGRRAWHIGPFYLLNKDKEDKAQRGPKSSIDERECLNWLNSKKPNSVVYVTFGSNVNFNDTQLMEIAMALEAWGKHFIWTVRKEKLQEGKEEWLPEGFEKRMEGKGLVIRGWAPQVLILEHEAVGGFVTHCGWNSTLEGVCAGLPLVTWPVSAEQFYNEKLVTEILRIGVGVGAKKWARFVGDSVKSEAIEKAVNRIMEGEEAQEMRSRARALAKTARKAFEEGGSSYSNLNDLIEELRLHRSA
ncbi:UDP-glucose flavonoid 3-O-glucosyltransferase 7 [Morus notabilis]|uniref:Glycosyltransferase n=2 Tax=Morus notabilis TaxID=981085 RepID=W9RY79_9ROSA|nr:UDP-glucose flavonoid 3-O-glucosyltransferase 7 [Morus notabilis]